MGTRVGVRWVFEMGSMVACMFIYGFFMRLCLTVLLLSLFFADAEVSFTLDR